jgi:hypothetical protein
VLSNISHQFFTDLKVEDFHIIKIQSIICPIGQMR